MAPLAPTVFVIWFRKIKYQADIGYKLLKVKNMECVKCDKCEKIAKGRIWDRKLKGWANIAIEIPYSSKRLVLEYCPSCKEQMFERLHISEGDFEGDDY